jgi:Kazal-type serine protease inhibitor domain
MQLHFGRFAVAAMIVVSGLALGLAGANAANLDEACGGPNHITCNSALYCQLPAGQCSAADVPGICAKAPDFCMRVSRPVCGCNGKTYMNECEARKARVAIDTTGACKKQPTTDGTAPAAKPKPAAKKPAAKKKKSA